MTNNKGITLIALVITIIVLLILAGVSIAMLTGNNGILTQATNAKNDTAEAEVADRINMALNGEYSSLLATKNFSGTADQIAATNGIEQGTGKDYTITIGNDGARPTTGGIVLTIASNKYPEIKGTITYTPATEGNETVAGTPERWTIDQADYPQ